MTYYVMWSGASEPGEKTRRIQGGRWGGLEAGAFLDGQKLMQPLTLPIQIDVFAKDTTGDMPPVFVVPDLVVRNDVRDALTSAGVDNIDYYPAVIRHTSQGEQWDDYWVGNVIGLVDAVDTNKSIVASGSPVGIAVLYEKMVIDESKCQGLNIFRLATRPGKILVSQRLKDALVSRVFPYLSFILPEDFA